MASPLLGYNTNVRHHGKVFHIQTEDSGVGHGHIFTHLFADGGRIIATKKTTYAQWVGTERYPTSVKKLMQAQHKAMFIALRDGLFDQDELAGAKVFSSREITIDEDAPSNGPPVSADASTGSEPRAPRAAAPAPTQTARDLDVDALERAASGYLASSDVGRTSPGLEAIPPRSALPTPPGGVSRPSTPSLGSSAGRYQATQPVDSVSGNAPGGPRTPRPTDSVFGSDFLSEKSLDEVIMSYLAEDLGEKE